MTKAHDDNLSAFGQLPLTGGMGKKQIARWFAMLMEDIEIVGGEMGDAGERLLAKVFSEETIAELGEMIKAHRLPVAPVKMLVDQDWLRRHVENDPDLDTEAASPPSHPDRREQYARIIDQEAFELIKHYSNLHGEEATFRAYPQLRERRDDALSKADQILALPVPGGWLPIGDGTQPGDAPRDGMAILAAWRTGAAGEGDYTVDKLWWAGQWCPYSRKPTYWQPLPAPPSAGGNG